MRRPEVERADTLLERADGDLAAVRALEAVDTVPDEVVGFHAQQAAEKLLKAVLAGHGIAYPRTHSLRFLLDLLADQGLAPPAQLHGITELYPFAVQLRYDAPLDEEPLDRSAARALLERLREWTAKQIPTS